MNVVRRSFLSGSKKEKIHLVFNQPVYAARYGIFDSVYDASLNTKPGKKGPMM